MKNLYCILLLLIVSPSLFAQWQSIFPIGINSVDVFFTSETTGYIIGSAANKGTIFKTIDSGASWKKVYTASDGASYYSVYFTDTATGYILTERELLKTSDGGNQWQQHSSDIPSGALTLQFTSTLIGYISCENGTVFKTADGGLNWHDTSVPLASSDHHNYEINILSFVSDKVGYAIAEWEVFKTTDGAESWQKLSPPSNRYAAIQFINETTGFLASYYGTAYKTIDGGSTWEEMEAGWDTNYAYFLDEKHGILFSDYSQIKQTLDGGSSSQEVYHSGYTFSWQTAHFPTKKFGCAIGSGGAILITHDGGQSWQMNNSPNAGAYYDMHFRSEKEGIVTGEAYGMIRTSDGGKSWYEEETSFNRNDKFGHYFADSDTGLIVVTNNGSFLTYDGGQTFFYDETRTPPFVGHRSSSDYFLLNSKVIYSTGSSGRIAKSTDGGKSWTINQPSFENYMTSITFPSPDTGYACGTVGKVIKTVDGGNTWQEQHTKINHDLQRIYFLDNLTGFAVGNFGIIIRTTDGGEHWSKVDTGIAFPLLSIHFFNATLGYVGSSTGQLACTIDGGKTWKIITDAEDRLNDVQNYYFKDTTTVYAMGSGLFHRDLIDRNSPPPVTGLPAQELDRLEQTLVLFPNPAYDWLSLSTPSGITPKQIAVYNHHGKLVQRFIHNNYHSPYQIDVSMFPAGVYYLKIADSGHDYIIKKFIKY